MEQYITLSRLRFYSRHGVDPQECRVGAHFTLSLRIATDFSRAMTTDDVADTLDYGAVYRAVRDEMDRPSHLLEHVAGRILRRLFADFPCIEFVALELTKDNPPMGADCLGAGIAVTASRADFE